jgi:hypothetical protein
MKKLKVIGLFLCAVVALPFICVYMVIRHPKAVWKEFKEAYKVGGCAGLMLDHDISHTKVDDYTYKIKTFPCPECGHKETHLDDAQTPFIGYKNFAVVPMVCNKCKFSFSLTIEGT